VTLVSWQFGKPLTWDVTFACIAHTLAEDTFTRRSSQVAASRKYAEHSTDTHSSLIFSANCDGNVRL